MIKAVVLFAISLQQSEHMPEEWTNLHINELLE